MELNKLKKILSSHNLWLQTGGEQGKRADLHSADLRSIDLRGIDLRYANLRDTDLRGADMRSTDLRYANLRDADLNFADLDFAAFPLWCGSLNIHIDDRQAKQLLYHLVRNVQYSKNISETLKKSLLTKRIIKVANEFHRAAECGKIILGEEDK